MKESEIIERIEISLHIGHNSDMHQLLLDNLDRLFLFYKDFQFGSHLKDIDNLKEDDFVLFSEVVGNIYSGRIVLSMKWLFDNNHNIIPYLIIDDLPFFDYNDRLTHPKLERILLHSLSGYSLLGRWNNETTPYIKIKVPYDEVKSVFILAMVTVIMFFVSEGIPCPTSIPKYF